VRDELGVPIVYVTHDRDEVLRLADRVVILEAGTVVRSGAPADVGL
jgi:ABC-type molybdate transport system ATPase subunit